MKKLPLNTLAELALAGAVIPEEANYIAMDYDGEWYAYTLMPHTNNDDTVWHRDDTDGSFSAVKDKQGNGVFSMPVRDISDYCYYIGEGDENV